MKCDTCKFKKIHIGYDPPDDYGMEYCYIGHWEGGPIDEDIDDSIWDSCVDYRCEDCNGSGAVKTGEGEYSACNCVLIDN